METWIQWITNGHPCIRADAQGHRGSRRPKAGTWQKTGYFHRVRAGGPPAVLAMNPLGSPLSRATRCAGICTLLRRVAVSQRGLCPLWELPPLSIYMRQGPIQCLEAVQCRTIGARWQTLRRRLQRPARPRWNHGTKPGARPQTRKPGGLSEVDSLPGLTADTTVFAIVSQGGDEGPPCEEARYCLQGVPWKFHLLHRGTECPSAGEFASSGDA